MPESKWDKLFREKLKAIWVDVNQVAKSQLDEELVGKHLKSIADDFLNTFKNENSPIPVEFNEYYYNLIHSVKIPLGTFGFDVPHMFYILAKLKTPPNLDPLFAMPVPWRIFLSYFFETTRNIRKPLKDSDVKIMSVLTRHQPKATDKVIPYSDDELGKLAGMMEKRKKTISKNTVGKNLVYLYKENILIDYFLTNPWTMGYTLKMIIYKKELDKQMEKWEKWTKYKQIFMSNKILRVIQIPQHAENEFIVPDEAESNEFNEYWHSNNINQLKPKSEDSFTSTPNFEVLKTSDYKYTKFSKDSDVKWIETLLNMTYSTKTRKEEPFASLNKLASNNRLEKAFKFLKFLSEEQKLRPPFSKAANRAGLEEIIFLDFIRFFIEQKVINFATRTSYIDCNYRIGVFISSLEKSVKDHPKLQLFLQNLLELPIATTFIGEYIIATYIALPLKWVGVFTTYINMLMTNSDLQIEFGTHMALQSYLYYNTPFSQDTILTSYGVLYNPSFEFNGPDK